MRRLFSALSLAALFAASAAAQPRNVQFRMDTGTFRYDDATSLAEVYLSIGAAGLPYVRAGDGSMVAAVPVHLTIRPVAAAAPAGAEQAAVYDQMLDFRFSVADTTTLTPGQVFTQQVRTALAPGEYELSVDIPATASTAQTAPRSSSTSPTTRPRPARTCRRSSSRAASSAPRTRPTTSPRTAASCSRTRTRSTAVTSRA